MFWIALLVIVFVVSVVVAAVLTKLDKSFTAPWIRIVEQGLRSWGEPEKTHVYRDDVRIFLAERTHFRVVKYNNQFYTQIKTFGTGWRDFVYRDQRSKWYPTLEQADRIIERAASDIRLYIDVSEYEDPNKYRKVVVSSHSVVVKEMR